MSGKESNFIYRERVRLRVGLLCLTEKVKRERGNLESGSDGHSQRLTEGFTFGSSI